MTAWHADHPQEPTMLPFFASTLQASSPATPLQRRQTFQLRARRGERIECRTGQLWVTQDGDPRDVILQAGQSFILDRAGAALISALEEASFVYRRQVPVGGRSDARVAPPALQACAT
jgi:hypothetical protein